MFNQSERAKKRAEFTARSVVIAMLVILMALAVLSFLIGISIVMPKQGRTWSTYVGHVLSEATVGLWRKIFGPPTVRVQRPNGNRAGNGGKRWK
jgi:NADH:ubiquinone oxidoreductase subunit 5 (subunit L)/multisubunit Na+/H+ antiporter MnhA subunit